VSFGRLGQQAEQPTHLWDGQRDQPSVGPPPLPLSPAARRVTSR
jgi:hypothetical protein